MGQQSIRFDIEVTFQRTRFKATSPAFPNCSGTGKSEEEAVDRLTNAISKRIADTAKQALSQISQGECLASETIFDDDDKPLGIRRSYELDSTVFGRPTRPITRLSYPSAPDYYKVPIEQDIRRMFGHFDTDFIGLHDTDHDDEPGAHGPSFGFPVSLN
ncbi:hypothetical protein EB093_00470 [bacterium]|nr:hypothetical protein [bacterium]